MTAEQIIQLLDLKPHPEGGYYRESYRSPGTIQSAGHKRAYSTAIYYLLADKEISKIHRLQEDELFHFYRWDPVTWVLLNSDGKTEKIVMGQDLQMGQQLQMAVSAGTWFGGYLKAGGFALMGTTMAPGFEFEDFTLGKREELLKAFPTAEKEILKLT